MSTPRCPVCKRYYWRYRGDFPPAGYCSVQCHQERRRRKLKKAYETCTQVMAAYREHRWEVHQTRDIVTWIDCEVCERFEERYAVSLYL